MTTGAFTALVPCPPGGGAANWTGLSIDPVSGIFYASTASGLYIIDPSTGMSTLVGPFGTSLMIAIAINIDGQMYGHDIGTDSIYLINMNTGAATLLGQTGYAANYAQGMDFDNDDGTLYIFLYVGGGANVYGTVNLVTGAVTPLATSNPQGEFEGAIRTTGFTDIPWLSETPTSGTINPGDCTPVDVTFDSTGLTLGDYFAGLQFDSNDPHEPSVDIPVQLTVLDQLPNYDGSFKLADPTTVLRGEPIHYTVVISNTGGVSVDTMMTDLIPTGTEFAGNLTCTNGDCSYDPDSNSVIWTGNVALPPLQAVGGVRIINWFIRYS